MQASACHCSVWLATLQSQCVTPGFLHPMTRHNDGSQSSASIGLSVGGGAGGGTSTSGSGAGGAGGGFLAGARRGSIGVFGGARRTSNADHAAAMDGPRAEVHVSIRMWGAPLSPFAVVYDERRRALRSRSRAEVGRTETITHAGGGGARTFLRSFLVRTTRNPNLRVAIFDFVKSSTVVEDHVFLGAVTFALADVLAAGVVSAKLVSATPPPGVIEAAITPQIVVTLRASRVDDALFAARRSIALRVVLPELRRRKFPHALVTQSFDISRASATADPEAGPSWVPVYRSEALAAPAASHERHIRFDSAIISEWRLYGLDTPLRIRLLQHSPRSVRVAVAAVCNTSLQELQVLDPSRDFLPLLGARSNGACIGQMFLTQAEPTKSGGVFSLTAQYHHFSLAGAKRALSLTMTRLATMRVERKGNSRPHLGPVMSPGGDEWSFDTTSVGSARSVDRFGIKLRRSKVASENNVAQWSTASPPPTDIDLHPLHHNAPRRRTPRWRSWFNT